MEWIIQRSRSLFFKIFISFLAVILLFCIFYTAIYHLFKTAMQEEIIQTNRSAVQHTAERLSTQLSRIQVLMFELYNDGDLIGFSSQLQNDDTRNADYLKARSVILQMRKDIYNPLFYLEDVIVHMKGRDFTLSKSGSSSASFLFNHLYSSSAYSLAYWNGQFSQPDTGKPFRLLPSQQFTINPSLPETKRLLPFVYKHGDGRYQVIAFIDIDKAMADFFGYDKDRSLAIFNREGTMLYQRGDASFHELPVFAPGQDSVLHQDMYYFKALSHDGLTYITAVPFTRISSQLNRLSGTLLLMLILSSLLAVAASFLLSRKLHTPVKRILSTVLDKTNRSAPVPHQEGILEYDLIQLKIRELQREKQDIRDKLNRHNSVLTSYTYINQLKSINTDISEWKDFLSAEGSYIILLYQIRFRMSSLNGLPVRADLAVRSMLEHIHLMTAEQFPGSHTFQIEKNEIASIIKGAKTELLNDMLADIQNMLDMEKSVFLVTIAVSSQLNHVSEFSQAYRQLSSRAAQAKLLEETQILFHNRSLPASVALSPAQEKEFNAALQSGNDARCLHIIDQALDMLHKKEAGIAQFRFFADSIASKVIYYLETLQMEGSVLRSLKQWTGRLADCCTIQDYRDVFRQLIEACCSLIRKQTSTGEEPLISKFLDIVQTKYMEDLSLDYLSAKLNLTSSYLSAYIKEKTGMNFSDHLQSVRMEKARELLVCTNLTVHEISQQVGYLNISSFNRTFKKTTGMTPGAYRKQHVV